MNKDNVVLVKDSVVVIKFGYVCSCINLAQCAEYDSAWLYVSWEKSMNESECSSF